MSDRASKLAAMLALGLTLTWTVEPALAAECYQPKEIEADQAMRYQAEIMVLSDTCGGDIYRDFTVRNRDQIVDYQNELLDHYRRVGMKKPQATLDTFLTHIANERALQESVEERQVVCQRSQTFLAVASTIDRFQLKSYVTQLATENRGAYKACK